MRRTLTPSVALLAGLVVLLSGCAGETTGPTPVPQPTPGPGTCSVRISLATSALTAVAGTPVVIRATVTNNGAAVPENESVSFTTDYGVFAETGQVTVTKLITSGVADVTLYSEFAGTAHVTARYGCGSSPVTVNFTAAPGETPFVSSIVPNSGSCLGAETVIINGGNFGTDASAVRVTFGGAPATIEEVDDNRLEILTPARTLANPQVPEAVDVVITVGTGAAADTVTVSNGFTYSCIPTTEQIYISSLSPDSGKQEGGDTVTILGGNFGTNVATTRVTFGGVAAQIISVADSQIRVTTPRHILANPDVPETVDVAVTRDLGLPSEQTAVLPRSFTYRAGTGEECPADPAVFISSVDPTTGSPEGGTVVTIRGGGFGADVAKVRVEFDGAAAQVTAVTDSSITVSTPRHPLANPNTPESVDVVVTSDVGGPDCATARLTDGFTYATVNVPPAIYSISPVTGPNDVSTRVTISGTGFIFPMQVFVEGGANCAGQKIEAQVVSIQPSQIVFLTPIAAQGNVCLANQLVSITVRRWDTGEEDTLADAFKYYSCPTASVATPAFGPYSQTTAVTINGQNFAEPVEAEWLPVSGGSGPVRLVVSSVSSAAIVVQLPPADPTTDCLNVAGEITLSFPVLVCDALTVPYTYRVDPPQVLNASPNQLPQGGGVTVTVSGAFFNDPMTVVLINASGGELAYTRVNNPAVSNQATLSFPAPAIRDADMNQQACIPTGGTTPTGSVYVPTSFGIRVTNARTGCTAELRNVLIYNPIDTTCRLAAAITGPTSLPAAVLCNAYGPATVTGTGTGALTWSLTMPAGYTGLTISPTGVISGTPVLATPGAGTASGTMSVVVTVTDSGTTPSTASRTYSVPFTDPLAPLAITGPATANISSAAGGTTAGFGNTPGAATLNWTIATTPTPAAGGITLTAASGTTTAVNVAVGTTAGSYSVVVSGSDACGHAASATLALTVAP